MLVSVGRRPGFQDERHDGVRRVDGQSCVTWFEGRGLRASSMSIPGERSELTHTVHDGRQPSEYYRQVFIERHGRRQPEMPLEDLPERMKRLLPRKFEVLAAIYA